ncbi:MAG: MATE family efflux transporter, partial [Treponema sp.]|nr:MATE family efflux transporter [Treponema sp.]
LAKERWDNRSLFVLIWPLIIEQILTVTMGTADTIMVSSVGEFAVSGVNIVDNINNLLIIAFTALSTGGAVVASQFIGRRDNQKVNIASCQLFYIVTAVSVLMMIITLSLRRQIIILFYGDIEADVMGAASIYFLISAISYPFLAIYSASAALFRAAGNSQVTMRIALMVNIIHIVGNSFFIYILKIGVAGVAVSTLASRFLAAIILTFLLMRNRRGAVNLDGLFKFQLNFPILKSILNIGIPSALENSMFQIGKLFTQRLFTPFGTSAFAANAVTNTLNSFSFMPSNAIGIALITVVGQCIGAGDLPSAKKYTVKLMKIAWVVIFIMSALMFFFKDPMIHLFNLGPDAHNLTRDFLNVYCVSMAIAYAFAFTLPYALRAAGDAKYVMITAAVTMWTVRVTGAYFLVYVLKTGPVGVWLAMGMDLVARGICFTFRWLRGKWQNKKVLAD